MTVHYLAVPDYARLKTAKYKTLCHHSGWRREPAPRRTLTKNVAGLSIEIETFHTSINGTSYAFICDAKLNTLARLHGRFDWPELAQLAEAAAHRLAREGGAS